MVSRISRHAFDSPSVPSFAWALYCGDYLLACCSYLDFSSWLKRGKKRTVHSAISSSTLSVSCVASDPEQLRKAREDIKELLKTTFCHPILVIPQLMFPFPSLPNVSYFLRNFASVILICFHICEDITWTFISSCLRCTWGWSILFLTFGDLFLGFEYWIYRQTCSKLNAFGQNVGPIGMARCRYL